MIRNLVRAEFDRLVTRRFTLVMVLLLLAAFGVTLLTVLSTTHRPTRTEVVSAERMAETARTMARVNLERCERARLSDAPETLRREYQWADCSQFDPDRIDAADYMDDVFSFTRSIRGLVYFLGAFLALFGFLVGASFVGAELTSGGMTNLLLWRPRRLQVLTAKLGTLLAGVAALAMASTLLYLATFWAVAEVAGYPGYQTGRFWGALVLVCLRGIVLALFAAAIGFAIATIGRHTSAAVGLVAGYVVIWELGARIVMQVVRFSGTERWMLTSYLAAWLDGEIQVSYGPRIAIHWWQAGLLFAALLAVLVGGSFAQFRRRDLS